MFLHHVPLGPHRLATHPKGSSGLVQELQTFLTRGAVEQGHQRHASQDPFPPLRIRIAASDRRGDGFRRHARHRFKVQLHLEQVIANGPDTGDSSL